MNHLTHVGIHFHAVFHQPAGVENGAMVAATEGFLGDEIARSLAPDPQIQCLIYDSTDSNANLVQVEWIYAKKLTRNQVSLQWNTSVLLAVRCLFPYTKTISIERCRSFIRWTQHPVSFHLSKLSHPPRI